MMVVYMYISLATCNNSIYVAIISRMITLHDKNNQETNRKSNQKEREKEINSFFLMDFKMLQLL